MKHIDVTKRYNDYHACIAGRPAYWGCGRNPSEAIGALIRTHSEQFQLYVCYLDAETKPASEPPASSLPPA